MKKVVFALTVAALVAGTGPVVAQGRGRAGDAKAVKQLEAELQKLREQMRDLEARLQKAKESARKGSVPGRPPWAGMGRGKWGPDAWKEMMEKFRKAGEAAKKPEKDGKRPGLGKGPPWGSSWGRSWDWRERRPGGTTTDIDRRLERILREVEELRRELKKK